MARKARMFIPGVPCHVVSRGNNRNTCFFSPDDYRFYLSCLSDACTKHHVDVHAYVLMTNHVHLLITPHSPVAIPKVMQSIGRRYVQYINKRYDRTGTLWESRYKASIIDAESYLLACYRYIELNPVRANIVHHPEDYLWSSYAVNAGLKTRKQLMPHETYLRLGTNDESRCLAYQKLVSLNLEASTVHNIRRAAAFSMPIGNSHFYNKIEQALGIKIGQAKRGRPKRGR